MLERLKKDEIWSGEIQNIRKNGSSYWVFSTISLTYECRNRVSRA